MRVNPLLDVRFLPTKFIIADEFFVCKTIVFPYSTEEGFIDDLRSALVAYS